MAAMLPLAAAALDPSSGIKALFECTMRPGDVVSGTVSEDDLHMLPPQWEIEVGVPLSEREDVRYMDPVLGSPIAISASYGNPQRSFYAGSADLVHSEFDWWNVDFTVEFTELGRAAIWATYFRVEPGEGRYRSWELHARGSCRESLSIPQRKPS
jgi:hypothetical protein